MTIFSRHAAALAQSATLKAEGGEDGTVVTVPVIDDAPVVDPLVPPAPTEDTFAEQRAKLNANLGTESLRQEGGTDGTPVDGKDDDMSTDKLDTDVELPEGEFEAHEQIDAELDQFEQESVDIDQLNSEVNMLVDSAVAIESFGFNPTALAILQTTGLLEGTALSSLALESVGYYDGNHAEAQLALEGLGDKILEKTAAASAKVLNVLRGVGDKVMAVLNPLFDKVSGYTKRLAAAAWDKTKAAGATIKAHPVATVLAVIAAIAAVGGIVALSASGAPAPGAKMDAMRSFVTKLAGDISKIKWPFGKVKAGVSEQLRLTYDSTTSAKEFIGTMEPVEKLGWTKAAVATAANHLDRAWNMIKDGWGAVSTRATKIAQAVSEVTFDDVKKGAKFAAKTFAKGVDAVASVVGTRAYYTYYVSTTIAIYMGLFRLTRSIVMGGLRLIARTFKALTGIGSAPEAATA